MDEKKLQKEHSKLFYQYLRSYVMILSIPLLLLSVFLGSYMLNVLKNEIHENNRNTLENAKNIVEAQLEHITSAEHKMYLNNLLKSFYLENETIAAIDTKDKLKGYCQMNPFLIDAAYYQAEDDYVIAASGSCRKELFWDTMYVFESWKYEDFLQDLDEHSEAFFQKSQKVYVKNSNYQNIVTLVIPLDRSAKRCVILLLDETFFVNVLPQMDKQEAVSAIIDENQNVLVSEGQEELLNALTLNAEDEKGAQILKIDGEKYQRSRVYSEKYQWSYEALILLRNIEKESIYVQGIMLVTYLLTLIAGLASIGYFMKKNYEPLHTLELASNEILKNEENKNEIDHVKNVLDYLHHQNQRMQSEELKRKNILRERFVLKWLSGHYETADELKEQAAKIGIILDKKCYQVGVLQLYRCEYVKMQKLEQLLKEKISPEIDLFQKTQIDTHKIFVVVGYETDKRSFVQETLFEIVSQFETTEKINVCLAMGTVVQDVEKVKSSYEKALKALEYKVILDDKIMISYEDIEDWVGNSALTMHPSCLEKYVRNKDTTGLDHFLQISLSEIKNQKMDIRQVHMLCNEFIYSLEKTIDHVNRDYFIEAPLCDRITGILEYDTVSELMELIRLIANDIIDHMNAQTDQSVKEQLLNYVAKNCYSADFSTTAMAESFHMSPSYLSRCFKQYIGMNLLDYVTELRINKAKELLLQKEKPIKEVSNEVGYGNVNSFNRRFKQVTDYTPGEWREQKK